MKQIHTKISQETLNARGEQRGRIELLRGRLDLLTGTDKVLMTMYIENGNSFRQIARLTRINESKISRRVLRLARRLIDGKYVACLRSRDKLTTEQMKIARDYFLKGLSINKIARRRRRSYYHIRKSLKRIRQVISEIEDRK